MVNNASQGGVEMIIGIGIDLIEIERVLKACEKKRFIEKYYTEKERELIKADSLKAASNFAVKEAISKMLGTGFRGFSPIDIEVLRDEKGKPYTNLFGQAKLLAEKQEITRVHVSITNTKKYVNAFVVGENHI